MVCEACVALPPLPYRILYRAECLVSVRCDTNAESGTSGFGFCDKIRVWVHRPDNIYHRVYELSERQTAGAFDDPCSQYCYYHQRGHHVMTPLVMDAFGGFARSTIDTRAAGPHTTRDKLST
eukprot:6174938-Pleurochrysis_carterae.AAC.4